MELNELILQGGSLAVVLLAFILILRWVLGNFTSSLKSIERAQYVMAMGLLNLSQQLLMHDLTVTGINPAMGADFEERDSKALAKYKEIQLQMNELKVAMADAIRDVDRKV